MDLESIMLNEVRQKQKMPCDFLYMWNLKNKWTNKKTVTDPERAEDIRVIVRGERDGKMGKMSEGEWEVEASIYGINKLWG